MQKGILIIGVAGFICLGYCQEMKVLPSQTQPQPIQQLQKKLENDTLVRMINEIEITDEQMPAFISKFREMANVIKKQKEAKEKLMMDTAPIIENDQAPKNIEEKIAEFDKTYQHTNETLLKIREDMRKFLNLKQQIKLILMMDEIIEQLLKQPVTPLPQLRHQSSPVQPQIPR